MMGKSKLKGHEFEFFEKGTNCTQASASQLSEIGRPMLLKQDERQRSLWKFYERFKTWNEIFDVFVNHLVLIACIMSSKKVG